MLVKSQYGWIWLCSVKMVTIWVFRVLGLLVGLTLQNAGKLAKRAQTGGDSHYTWVSKPWGKLDLGEFRRTWG